jgi:hypothetical protein
MIMVIKPHLFSQILLIAWCVLGIVGEGIGSQKSDIEPGFMELTFWGEEKPSNSYSNSHFLMKMLTVVGVPQWIVRGVFELFREVR